MKIQTSKKRYALQTTNALMVLKTLLGVKEGIFAEKEPKLKSFVKLDLTCLYLNTVS